MAKQSNALNALLAAEVETVETVHIKRLGVDFTVKAITSEQLNKINDQAKGPDGKVDEASVNGILIATACVDPKFGDTALREKYGVQTAGDVVNKALLAGEVISLVQKIMEISGFNEDIESVKN